jgi:leucyl aminopeptidase
MNLSLAVASGNLKDIKADLLIGILFRQSHLFNEAPLKSIIGPARRDFLSEKITGAVETQLPEGFSTRRILLCYADSAKNLDIEERLASAVSEAITKAETHGFLNIALLCDRGVRWFNAVIRGAVLGTYAFTQYKSKKEDKKSSLLIHVATRERRLASKTLQNQINIMESVNLCRNLVNEPANVLDTSVFVKRAKQVARACGLNIRVIEKDELRKRGCNGLLTVGAGGKTPPRMVILKYRPGQSIKKHLVLVGKGIVFDSGGISLKKDTDMWTMKGDMAGAATVLSALKVISLLKPRIQVSAILCLAENLPDSNATRPGDIFIAANRKSVHVENTDAEGRLVLSDGLFMAGTLGATQIVDVATLTGACVIALGEKVAGLMGNNKKFMDIILRASRFTGETLWPLPLYPEYREMLDIHCADINNIGNARYAGALTGGLFLKEFVPENTPWAHLDIAGPSFTKKKWKYLNEGATGFGVQTLARTAALL